jgi:hypothetical protein
VWQQLMQDEQADVGPQPLVEEVSSSSARPRSSASRGTAVAGMAALECGDDFRAVANRLAVEHQHRYVLPPASLAAITRWRPGVTARRMCGTRL